MCPQASDQRHRTVNPKRSQCLSVDAKQTKHIRQTIEKKLPHRKKIATPHLLVADKTFAFCPKVAAAKTPSSRGAPRARHATAALDLPPSAADDNTTIPNIAHICPKANAFSLNRRFHPTSACRHHRWCTITSNDFRPSSPTITPFSTHRWRLPACNRHGSTKPSLALVPPQDTLRALGLCIQPVIAPSCHQYAMLAAALAGNNTHPRLLPPGSRLCSERSPGSTTSST